VRLTADEGHVTAPADRVQLRLIEMRLSPARCSRLNPGPHSRVSHTFSPVPVEHVYMFSLTC